MDRNAAPASERLRNDALRIWQAAVAAADSSSAITRNIQLDATGLRIAGRIIDPARINQVIVVGAGKAGAGMAAGLETALSGTPLFDKLTGWVNVPENCVRKLQRIHLHGGRPAGVNEPTQQVIDGTDRILRLVRSCTPADLCIMLLSGGGSALLCRPVPGISLTDKLAVTRLLSRSGAPIHELNLVRTQLSLVKGGRLAAACQARLLVTLAISDVAGDPPQVIGSGPTVPVNSQPAAALEILERRGLLEKLPPAVIRTLQSATEKPAEPITVPMAWQVVASNSASLQAAAGQAEELGYRVAQVLRDVQGDAATAGADFQRRLQALKQQSRGQRLCLLAGGETTVNLASAGENPGRGGRNQEFVLSAAQVAADSDAQHSTEGSADWALLSGGTDGEDGPTDAAGGILDKQILKAILAGGYEIQDCLTRHDSWTLLDSVGALIRTGATHTNVMDIAVGLTAT